MASTILRPLYICGNYLAKHWKQTPKYVSTNSQEPKAFEKEAKFGFQTVTEEEKAAKVQEVFSNVASRYDTMNDVMSGGLHRLWKDHFVATLNPVPGTRLIDVAGGTGDIAFRFLQFIRNSSDGSFTSPKQQDRPTGKPFETLDGKPTIESTSSDISEKLLSHVTVCDINGDMLKVGEDRAKGMGFTGEEITWVKGDAQQLPFDDNAFDCYTIAFGIRNVVDVDKALKEAFRVLRPGGRFLCLEFSYVSNPLIGTAYDFYSFQVIPVMGQIIAGDWKSYQYLVESIRNFPKPELFETMLVKANFRNVYHEKLFFGVVAIHSGYKL